MTLDEKNYSLSIPLNRNTLHFAINGPVSSHAYGNWDDTKYAVLVPFTELPRERIASANSVDTYTHGGVDLTSKCFVLCPKGEETNLKRNNPNVNVISYSEGKPADYVPALLNSLGYRTEGIGQWAWDDSKSQKRYVEIMEKNQLKMHPHFLSDECELEQRDSFINNTVAALSLIKKKNIINKEEDIPRIYNQLKEQQFFNTRICDKEYPAKECEMLERAGIHISPNIQKLLIEHSEGEPNAIKDVNKLKEMLTTNETKLLDRIDTKRYNYAELLSATAYISALDSIYNDRNQNKRFENER